jgi:SAM-dependent methyltransferase
MQYPRASADPAAAALLASSEHARRAASFGAAAAAYAEHRPDYPAAGIRWALGPVTAPGRPVLALDLGAGTGKLTAQLAGQVSVVAVEPDPAMLAELRRRLPSAIAMNGRAEAIPLRDACVDAVLAGQAAHWFDLGLAMPEIARVLVPGGVFAGLWNADDDRVGWVADLHRISGRRSMALLTTAVERDNDGISGWLGSPGKHLFLPPERSSFDHALTRTADSLIETMRTHSMFLIMEPAEREAVLGRVLAHLAATPPTASGEFSLPIQTLVVRAVRR